MDIFLYCVFIFLIFVFIFFNKVCVCARTHTCPWRPLVSVDSPRAGVISSAEQLDWMLGTELLFSEREIYTLNH